ncbi:MAG: Rpn family recombination-promoting nuclease/putative transposase [Clostridiales bacterium]|nr:Rpn family recombination-promoting nuclease/putative transposase [Clostridiales bacterium]
MAKNDDTKDKLTSSERTDRRRKRFEAPVKLQRARLLDDEFLRCYLRGQKTLAEQILRIIMNRSSLVITSMETQADMKRLLGARSICLDVYALDENDTRYDIEVQRAPSGANPRRARYHASVMDIENLDARQDFEELPETYTIFITESDVFGYGKARYLIERMNRTTGNPFNDGTHILYVNAQYRDDSDIGKLMHDFCCSDPDEMYFPTLAERARYLKHTGKGENEMSQWFDEMLEEERQEAREEGLNMGRAEGRAEGREEGRMIVLNAIQKVMDNLKLTVEDALDFMDIQAEDRPYYRSRF